RVTHVLVVRGMVDLMNHRLHLVYFEAVCGARETKSGLPLTCLACLAWKPAPLRPSMPFEKHWMIDPIVLKAGDVFEIKGSNARMVAIDDLRLIAIERYDDDHLYAVDDKQRRWPMDLPT